MRVFTYLIAIALAIAVGLPTAGAATILFDDFDGYADQAAYEASPWSAVGTFNQLSTEQSVSAPNSIKVGAETVSNNLQRSERSFTATTPSASNPLVFSFDFYDTNAAASPYRQYVNLQAPIGPTASLVSMGLNNNLSSAAEGGNFYMARVLGINGSAYFKLNDGGPDTLRSTGWHNLAVTIGATQMEFFVDGILAKTVANTSLQAYNLVRVGSGLTNAGNAAYYDNVLIATIPEPASFVLAGLGLLGIIFAGRRRSS